MEDRSRAAPMDFERSYPQPDEHHPWLSAAMNTKFTFTPPEPAKPAIKPKILKTTETNTETENIPRKRPRPNDIPPEPNYSTSTEHSLPYLLSSYIQLMFGLSVIGILLYMMLQLVMTVRHDLMIKEQEYQLLVAQQISECSRLYLVNRCAPKERIPAMQVQCSEWELCMQKDPKEVGRLKVGAETLADILNKLVDPLSYKTMIFGTIFMFGALYIVSLTFQSVWMSHNRSKPTKSKTSPHPPIYNIMPPYYMPVETRLSVAKAAEPLYIQDDPMQE